MSEGSHEAEAQHKIIISDANLQEVEVETNDRLLTGRQIARMAGIGDPDEKVVLYRSSSGGLVELGEDDSVKVADAHYFWVAESDRTFRFEINGTDYVWPLAAISGRVLFSIGGLDEANVTLLFDREDQPDQEIARDTVINLDAKGFERFRSRPRERGHRIFVNDHPFTVQESSLSGAQIMSLGGVASDYQLFLEQEGDDKPIDPSSSIKLEDGMRFYALPKATFG